MARSEGPSTAALATLGALAERVRPVTLAREQRLPVVPALETLVAGGGLRRGSVLSVSEAPGASGAGSLALALAARASAAGSWAAGVGLPSLGLAAAAELGVALERLVLVAAPERQSRPTVVATLVDGFDLVLVGPHQELGPADARRLVARARERGTVLVRLDGSGPGSENADLRLRVTATSWEGLGAGHGHLRARRVTIEAGGRGEASHPRRADLWLPGPGGGVEVALPPPVTLPVPAGAPRRPGQDPEPRRMVTVSQPVGRHRETPGAPV
jgi:hypothetical protein